VHQYVTKPWDERELKMIIDRGLDRYAAAQRQAQLTADLDAAVRSEEAVRSIFQRFVPPEVTEKLLRDTAAAPPSPAEGREVTLLFADIRGFTSICSSHPPPVILDLLNEYFARMTELIEESSGAVNQFLGDGILAVFGAPMELVDSARFAVRAALQMVEEIERFNARARQLIGQPLTIGIGIQQGIVALGVATAQDRAFYCAAGAPIYQVMELEARSKGHHNSIVITDDVCRAAGDRIDVCMAGAMTGSSGAPVPLYRITGVKS
jgi:adenylate cyclase